MLHLTCYNSTRMPDNELQINSQALYLLQAAWIASLMLNLGNYNINVNDFAKILFSWTKVWPRPT